MRSLLRLMAIIALFSLVEAQAFFPINPLIQVRRDVVSAQVYNPHYEPIICEGMAFGQTMYGQVFQARITDIIPPGNSRFAFVRTNFSNPFVNGWGQVVCRFARWY